MSRWKNDRHNSVVIGTSVKDREQAAAIFVPMMILGCDFFDRAGARAFSFIVAGPKLGQCILCLEKYSGNHVVGGISRHVGRLHGEMDKERH